MYHVCEVNEKTKPLIVLIFLLIHTFDSTHYIIVLTIYKYYISIIQDNLQSMLASIFFFKSDSI